MWLLGPVNAYWIAIVDQLRMASEVDMVRNTPTNTITPEWEICSIGSLVRNVLQLILKSSCKHWEVMTKSIGVLCVQKVGRGVSKLMRFVITIEFLNERGFPLHPDTLVRCNYVTWFEKRDHFVHFEICMLKRPAHAFPFSNGMHDLNLVWVVHSLVPRPSQSSACPLQY